MAQTIDVVRRLRREAGRGLHGLASGITSLPFGSSRTPELRGQPIVLGPVRMLSLEPPVFLSGIPYDAYLGVAPTFASRYGNIPAGFVIYPTWSIETPRIAKRIREAVRRHTRRYNQHEFRYICNTPGEARLLNQVGQKAEFLNHKFTVSEQVFRPLESIPVEFDAIYNARFVAGKRHELAAEIDKVAYISYVESEKSRRAEFQKLSAAALKRSPGHVLLNRIEDGLPVTFSHSDVNQALSRAATGLILSHVEGASYATMEYMLAGLAVVSTPSLGGRDAYFDPEYCAVVDPEPKKIARAVAELRARNIPRQHIREQTLKRIQPGRERFMALIDELIRDLGGSTRFGAGAWPLGDISGVPWGLFEDHVAQFERDAARALERDSGLEPGTLHGVQLSVNELRPILHAVRSKPGGSLLVFGCGNDSPFWERANAGGLTTFIEDDEEWAARAQAQLSAATVHLARYGTHCADWRKLLGQPDKLSMALPDQIRSRQWDLILVDGPAGYRDDLPGRMKSIFEASRLVAPGGKVFVHDAERLVEDAYSKRYLGSDRLFLEVRGRAVLRAYAF